MKRTSKKSLNRRRCTNSCLYFLADESDSKHDNQDMYDINIPVISSHLINFKNHFILLPNL